VKLPQADARRNRLSIQQQLESGQVSCELNSLHKLFFDVLPVVLSAINPILLSAAFPGLHSRFHIDTHQHALAGTITITCWATPQLTACATAPPPQL